MNKNIIDNTKSRIRLSNCLESPVAYVLAFYLGRFGTKVYYQLWLLNGCYI